MVRWLGEPSCLRFGIGKDYPFMNVLIVYYSTYGNVYKMATLVAEGVKDIAGAEPVIRTVPELIPQSVIDSRVMFQMS